MAAVDKIEEKRKPEDFIGHRNRRAGYECVNIWAINQSRNRPPIDFRMSKAKAILKSDYSSIEQVAQSVNYNSIYHFSKMFKTYTGANPTEYAKTSRK